MKLLTYCVDQRERLGFLSKDGQWVLPMEAANMEYKAMQELIVSIGASEILLLEHIAGSAMPLPGAIPLEEVRILPPIPVPSQDIICLGMNYSEHAGETGEICGKAYSTRPQAPIFFSKRVDRARGQRDEIFGHWDLVDSLDYEVELAVIMARDAFQVPIEQARDYIFGYTILNDITARNLQHKHGQWYFGKSLDGFAPMGPWIVTANEFDGPLQLRICSKVNGEPRQDSNTGQLLFSVEQIISQLSQGMTLKAGTIISTGTPAGVGMGFHPPRYLQPGDQVECTIEGIGTLVNKIR